MRSGNKLHVVGKKGMALFLAFSLATQPLTVGASVSTNTSHAQPHEENENKENSTQEKQDKGQEMWELQGGKAVLSGHTLTLTGTAIKDFTDPKEAPWYEKRASIHEIHVEEGMLQIGDYAFADCSNLIRIQLPESLQGIGKGAFRKAVSLKQITFPEHLVQIEEQAFYYAIQLKEVAVSPETNIAADAFSGCYQMPKEQADAFQIEIPQHIVLLTLERTEGQESNENKTAEKVYGAYYQLAAEITERLESSPMEQVLEALKTEEDSMVYGLSFSDLSSCFAAYQEKAGDANTLTMEVQLKEEPTEDSTEQEDSRESTKEENEDTEGEAAEGEMTDNQPGEDRPQEETPKEEGEESAYDKTQEEELTEEEQTEEEPKEEEPKEPVSEEEIKQEEIEENAEEVDAEKEIPEQVEQGQNNSLLPDRPPNKISPEERPPAQESSLLQEPGSKPQIAPNAFYRSARANYKLGWNQDENGWRYAYAPDQYYKNGWQYIDNNYFYFKADGYTAVRQWIGDNYVNDDGYCTVSEVPNGDVLKKCLRSPNCNTLKITEKEIWVDATVKNGLSSYGNKTIQKSGKLNENNCTIYGVENYSSGTTGMIVVESGSFTITKEITIHGRGKAPNVIMVKKGGRVHVYGTVKGANTGNTYDGQVIHGNPGSQIYAYSGANILEGKMGLATIGGYIEVSGANIHSNQAEGIHINGGQLVMNGGRVYANKGAGILIAVAAGVGSPSKAALNSGFIYSNGDVDVNIAGNPNFSASCTMQSMYLGISRWDREGVYTPASSKGGIRIWPYSSVTIKEGYGRIYNNQEFGISNASNLNISPAHNTNIFGGCTYGIKNIGNGVSHLKNTGIYQVKTGILCEGGTVNYNANSYVSNCNSTGVKISGGTFQMNAGAKIHSNNANNGGGVYLGGGTFHLKGGEIQKNYASDTGGGVHVAGGTFSFTGGSILNNEAFNTGGGVEAKKNFNMSGGAIYGNKAKFGAGVRVRNEGNFNFTNGSIYSNVAANDGGGIYLTDSGKCMQKENAVVRNNTAAYYGGGVCVIGNGSAYTLGEGNPSVHDNTATSTKANGGGICVLNNGTVSIEKGQVRNNKSNLYGGGVSVIAGTLHFSSGDIKTNHAVGNGGGIYIASGGKVYQSNTAYTHHNEGENGGGVFLRDNGSYYELENGNIDNNTASKNGGGLHIWTNAAAVIKGGQIYSNGAAGEAGGIQNAEGTLTISGGKIFDNTAPNGGGVNNSTNGTFTITGGEIRNNQADYGGGIRNRSICRLQGGSIHDNTGRKGGGGVYNNGTCHLSGTAIESNRTENSTQGNGIYNETTATLNMSGAAHVNQNNAVYLAGNSMIHVTGELKHPSGTVATITPSQYILGKQVVSVDYGNKTGRDVLYYANNQKRFALSSGGAYQLLRESNDVNNMADHFILISEAFTVAYDKNTTETVTGMPQKQTKYWNEDLTLKVGQPVRYLYLHKGWSTDKDVASGNAINGNVYRTNADITYYAIWKIKEFKIHYDPNGGSGEIQTTITENPFEYEILSNEQTEFVMENASFRGWSLDPDVFDKDVLFRTDDLPRTVDITKVDSVPEGDRQVIHLYAIWDDFPDIVSGDTKNTLFGKEFERVIFDEETGTGTIRYYEGEKPTKADILSTVKATDREDDIEGKELQIKIASIVYSKKKLVEEYIPGQPSSSERMKLEPTLPNPGSDDIPDDFILDTWLYHLDKADKVEHKMTLTVTDSVGNKTEEVWNIQVLYNEFPTIEARDRYFLLEEALEGRITYNELLTNVHALDAEDGNVTDKVEILNYDPDAYKNEDGGDYNIIYNVVDSLEKTTTRSIVLKVVPKQPIKDTMHTKYVRYINSRYFLDEDGNPIPEEEGGLNNRSIWLTDESYKSALLKVLNNKEEDGDWEYVSETWYFRQEDIKKVKEYVENLGILKAFSPEGLDLFLEKFNDNKK